MKRWIIDRFEGDFAVCEGEDGCMENIARDLLPEDGKEGDCLLWTEEGGYQIDSEASDKRRERIERLMESLFEEPCEEN